MKKINLLLNVLLFAITSISVPGLAAISKEQAYLVHATAVFPDKGILVAGHQLAPLEPRINVSVGLSYIRLSVHWALNSLAYPHAREAFSEGPSSELMSREQRKYAVVEPFKAVEREIFRSPTPGLRLGNWQDIATVGSHRITREAAIFVPKDDGAALEKASEQNLRTVAYTGLLRDAIAAYMSEHGALVLRPAEGAVFSPTINEESGMVESKVLGAGGTADQVETSSAELASDLGLDNLLNMRSPYGETEVFLLQSTMMLNISLALSDPITPLTAENCPPLINKMMSMIGGSYAEFVGKIPQLNKELAEKMRFGEGGIYCSFFATRANFDRIKVAYGEDPLLLSKIEEWERLVTIWFKYFLSQDPEFAAWRAAHDLDTAEGFLAAAREIYEQTREQAQRLQLPIEWSDCAAS